MTVAVEREGKTFDEALVKDRLLIMEKLGIEPTIGQLPILSCPSRARIIGGGERAGKSETSANDMTGSMFALGAELMWLFGADFGETSQEYGYIARNLQKLGILKSARKNYNPGEIVATTGTVIKTVSGKDMTKIGREAPDYILVCEASKIDYMTYLRLQARLAEKRGLLLMGGTFEGSIGWYPELFNAWQAPNPDGVSFSLPTWSNNKIFPGGRSDPEILRLERILPKDVFLERFAGVPVPPHGIVFDEFRVIHHVKECNLNPDYPVYLWCDPGYAGAYAVLAVQIISDHIYIIDEVYEQHLTTRQVISACKLRPWWRHVNPVGVMDIAGKQHQANESVAEIWESTGPDGAGIRMNMQLVPIQAGIDRYRDFLKVNPISGYPSISIDPKCRGLISEHGGMPNPFTGEKAIYSYPVDKNNVVISEIPIDKNNHAIKAMIYGIVDRFSYTTRSNTAYGPQSLSKGGKRGSR